MHKSQGKKCSYLFDKLLNSIYFRIHFQDLNERRKSRLRPTENLLLARIIIGNTVLYYTIIFYSRSVQVSGRLCHGDPLHREAGGGCCARAAQGAGVDGQAAEEARVARKVLLSHRRHQQVDAYRPLLQGKYIQV